MSKIETREIYHRAARVTLYQSLLRVEFVQKPVMDSIENYITRSPNITDLTSKMKAQNSKCH